MTEDVVLEFLSFVFRSKGRVSFTIATHLAALGLVLDHCSVQLL